MFWVLQHDLYREDGMTELLRILERMEIPHEVVKVVPFVGELIPDVQPEGPVVCMGAYSMIKTARARGWTPGVWSNGNFDFSVWGKQWGEHCLNNDARITEFQNVADALTEEERRDGFFMRPAMDSKAFSGDVTDLGEYTPWRRRVVELNEQDGSTLRPDTPVIVSTPKHILREYRLWVVDGEVVTASQYKLGSRVVYDGIVDTSVIAFGMMMIKKWVPDRAFVLDVALVENHEMKIVEINSLNAAGLYAANVGRLVEAIENMGYI